MLTVWTPLSCHGCRCAGSLNRAAPYTVLPALASDSANGPATQPVTPVTKILRPVIAAILISLPQLIGIGVRAKYGVLKWACPQMSG